jgi:hypothetical protein
MNQIKLIVLSYLSIATFVKAQSSLTASREVIFSNEPPRFTMNYTIDYSNPENSTISMTLNVFDYNTTDWLTDGTTGFYVGVGYNTTTMVNSDITFCTLLHTGDSDTFICQDGFIGDS